MMFLLFMLMHRVTIDIQTSWLYRWSRWKWNLIVGFMKFDPKHCHFRLSPLSLDMHILEIHRYLNNAISQRSNVSHDDKENFLLSHLKMAMFRVDFHNLELLYLSSSIFYHRYKKTWWLDNDKHIMHKYEDQRRPKTWNKYHLD